jgi:hypothetical protein
MSRRRLVIDLISLTAAVAYTVWFYTRPKPDTAGVPFSVPDAGITVRFPRPDPEPVALAHYLIADDRPGGADRWEHVKAFLAAGGRIQSWWQTSGEYRFALRIHEPPPVGAEQVKRLTAELLTAPGNAGPDVTNLPILDERRTEVKGRPGRVVLVDAGDRRVLTMFFFADGRMVFLFVEKAGNDLAIKDPKAAEFFGSVEFTPK